MVDLGNDWPAEDDRIPVEGALRAAFDAENSAGQVLRAIARRTKVASSVHLRDEDWDTALLAAEPGWSVASRYTVSQELGRGGVGVVLRGRDGDLGRQVALKFLRPDRLGNPLLVRRFLQEAQIEGQLQHPGIVPVYELGITSDGRPFFAMKLVRGRTLGALLAERPSPESDRRRFLGIFEQICQAVAYAHARGVVHRDLKPENVMIGRFGEVQVVDWGLAKVLDEATGGPADTETSGPDSEEPDAEERIAEEPDAELRVPQHTRAGSVLGTPPYMPPEQAGRGNVPVDERADVFALGAVLLEILTGAPPYRGGPSEVFLQAVHADLGDAWARLDGCPADADLVALCRACLAPEPADRPRDARVLALRLGAHLSAVEDRTRRAEVAAAEAHARAAGERRARRLTVALAAAVLLAAGLGSAAWLWVASERRERAEQASRGARRTLAEASELLGEARGAAPDDLVPWDGALARARVAVDLARGGAPEEEVRASETFLSLVEAERVAAVERRDARDRDRAMAARLDGIRAARGEAADLRATEAAYREAFRGYGIPVHDGSDTSGAVAASPIAGVLVAALDEWAWLRRRLAGAGDALGVRLLAIADAADPDPTRRELRASLSRASPETAGLAGEGGLSPEAALFLGRHLALAGDSRRAADVLRGAWRARPEDAWTSFELAETLTLPPEPSWDEAAGYFRAALAASPANGAIRARLAFALRGGGRLEEAISTWRQALLVDPGDLEAYRHLIALHAERGDLTRAVADLEAAARADPADPRPYLGIGLAYLLRGEYEEAVRHLEHAVALEPGNLSLRTHLAEALLWSTRPEVAESTLREVLAADESFAPAWEMLHRVRIVRGDDAGALEAVRKAAALDPESALYQFGFASALLFLGHLDEALAVSDRFVDLAPFEPLAHSVRGSVLLRRDDLEGAVAALERAVALVQGGLEAAPWGLTSIGEYDRETDKYKWRHVPGWDPNLGSDRLRLSAAKIRLGDLPGALAALDVLPWRPEATMAVDWTRQRILMTQGRLAEALPLLERIVADPHAGGEIRTRLGVCLLAADRVPEARVWLLGMPEVARWMPGWRYPEASWAEDVDGFVALRGHLRDPQPELPAGLSPEESLRLGFLCLVAGRHRASTAAFEAAFECSPGLKARFAYWPLPYPTTAAAAMVAALAGAGIGSDVAVLDDAERARLRGLALAWMRQALLTLEAAVAQDPAGRASWVPTVAEDWLTQDAFAPVRDEANLRRLAPEEADAWRSFWSEVRLRLPASSSERR